MFFLAGSVSPVSGVNAFAHRQEGLFLDDTFQARFIRGFAEPGPSGCLTLAVVITAKREIYRQPDEERRRLEDNTGHNGHRIWLDQNRIIAAFGKLALNT